MAKIVMSWNINKEDEATYFEFVVQEWLPELMKLGLRPMQAWYTLYGDGPQIISTAEAVTGDDLDGLRNIVRSDEWKTLVTKLDRYVTDYKQRLAK